MNNISNNNVLYRRLTTVFALFLLLCPGLWAAASKDKIESVTAEGGEIWQNDFDVSMRKKGLYNYIVYGRDRAGNEATPGAVNVRIDPNSGLPLARVVYPEDNSIVRQNINVLGVASGRFGVERVAIRLDDGDYIDASGAEYWNKLIDFASVSDGRHTLYVQAFDAKGLSGPEQSVRIILDTSPPQIELTSHNVGDIISGTTTIKGVASDPNGIRSLEFSEDGENFKSFSVKNRGDSKEFSIPLKSKNMDDGPLVYYVKAVDNTGIAAVKPYLFFISNNGPELELYTPAVGENVFGAFLLSGRAYAKIGIAELYYEMGKTRENIEIRPGDPYWSIPIEIGSGGGSIKVTAKDKIGNVTSVTRKLEDRRKVKTPVLVIDYPPNDMLNAMSGDAAIFGHIENVDSQKVIIDGIGEVDASSGFRIGADMIPPGKKTIKLTPIAKDGAKGSAVSVKYNKIDVNTQGEAHISVTSPAQFGWVSGRSFSLQGNVSGSRLQIRLDPSGDWRTVNVDSRGHFAVDVDISQRQEGPVHLELSTGDGSLPVYHPINVASSQPDIEFASPPAENPMIHGNKTIIGFVEHNVPLTGIAYSLDGDSWDELPFTMRQGKAWFSYFCDFTALGILRGKLAFRVTDASGASYTKSPNYTLNPNPPLPQIIVNTPTDSEVITAPFGISGVAFDDVGIHSVHWRILGPKLESISPGAAGRIAREKAEAFLENPNVPFQQLLTDQNFDIPIDFSIVSDGEYNVEIYAADPYGVKSETVNRVIKVSTAPPETRIMYPVITRYNNHAILMKGFSSDANGIGAVSISMDNGNTWQDVTLHEDGSWEIALNTTIYNDGIYSALIRTKDNYEITSFSNAMVNIDNTPPELYLSSPQNGQHVGSLLQIVGRVSDNIHLKSLNFQIVSAENPEYQRSFEMPPELVIFESMSLTGFPQGEYIVRVVSTDLADNESIVSRKIVYDADDEAAQIAIFNPLPGEIHTGAINVVGTITGSFLPSEVQLMMNGRPLSMVSVDRYGVFHYEIPEEDLGGEGQYKVSANYRSETGKQISSPDHTVYYSPFGPILILDSHQDGDAITKRPWLKGRAMYSVPTVEGEERKISRREQADYNVSRIEISYDNGRSFAKAKGGSEWKFRLETGSLPVGPLPVVVRAVFANGEEAVRRVMLTVDTTEPQVVAISPPENSVHRDNILVYGTASDNYQLADVDLLFRPRSKFWYSVPGAIQGLYLDAKAFGATWFDVGIGLSFFNDNVRFQGQFGMTPVDGSETQVSSGGRFDGNVFGIKLLANIYHLPFDYLFGPDWAFYSMSLAIGANFSWFQMDEGRKPVYMGAVVGQWDIANVDMQFFNPKWKYFHNFALYLEPELWFASTDVQSGRTVIDPNDTDIQKVIFRMTVGMRFNFF